MSYNEVVQAIADATQDAQTLEDVVNGAPDTQYKSRLGRKIWTLATINNRVDVATNQANQKLTELQDAINTAAAAGAGAKGWTDLLVNNADGKPLRNVIVEQIESIADLSKIEKINKRTVLVKSYYAGQGKGGGTFVYDATKANTNDGALVFNGWVRQLESDVFTPYMAGCKCDGVTDDAQNLDKLNLALYRNKLKGRIVFDSDILINSELARTDNLAFVDTAIKVGVRLVGGVHLEIKKGASIKIGNHFDDSSTNVFCGANYQSADDWQDVKHQDNVHIFGGGTIDSTQAGGMTSKHGTQRYLIMLGGLSNFKMYGITTVGGDYSNIVVARPLAKGCRVYDCTFKDTLVTNSYSQDHSTIWSAAPDWKVYNNTFSDASIKAQIMSCAFESHGSENYFYNNKINGYYVAFLQCAFAWDVNQPSKDNTYVYGNTANTWYFMQFWFQEGGAQPFGFMDAHHNKHTVMPYISKQTLLDAGVIDSVISIRGTSGLTKRAFVASSGAIAKDYEIKVLKSQVIRDNDYFASFSAELTEPFYDMQILFNEGLTFTGNNIKAPQLFIIKNQYESLGINFPHVIKNYVWKDNNVDFSGVTTKTVAELKVYRMNNCTFEVNFNRSYPPIGATDKPVIYTPVTDPDYSKNNTLIFTTMGQSNIATALSGIDSTIFYNANFARNNNNKIVVDVNDAIIYLQPLTDAKMAKVFTVYAPQNYRKVEVLAYDETKTKGFALPSMLYKTATPADVYVGFASDYTQSNTSTDTFHTRAYIRVSN